MLFMLAAMLMVVAAFSCWIGADRALAQGDTLAAVGYGALYAGLAAVVLVGVA